MTMTTGMVLADRYQLTHRLAVGGMGEVWAAHDTRLAREVAVKILKPELTSDPEFVTRFRSEAQITASLSDPGIAAVHDYGEVASIPGGARDTAYLVMEMVAGESLAAVLARVGRLDIDRTLDLLAQCGRALQTVHGHGLVHRDIKPGNIMITPAGQVKITDFGIAKAIDHVPVTRHGLVMGTAQYFAPEQAAGYQTGPASDIYALGVVGYECLAGARPFDNTNPVAIATAHVQRPPPPLPPDIPPNVALLIMIMLAKDVPARYPDGASLAAACGAVQAGNPPPLPATSPGMTSFPGWPALGVAAPPAPGWPGGTSYLPGGAPTGPPPAFLPAPSAPVPAPGSVQPTSNLNIVVSRAPIRRPPRRRPSLLVLALVIMVVALAAAVILVTHPEWITGAGGAAFVIPATMGRWAWRVPTRNGTSEVVHLVKRGTGTR